jgi:3-oxoacyl-(acyl-carrier-protein) synthase
MLCCVCVVSVQHEEFYNNLLAGKSGVTEISTFDASQFTTRFAGEVKVCSPPGLCGSSSWAMSLSVATCMQRCCICRTVACQQLEP